MNQWRKEHTQQDLYWTYYYEWKEVMAQFQRRRRSMAPFFQKDSPGILWDFCRRGMKWIFQKKRTSVEHKKSSECSVVVEKIGLLLRSFFLYIFWPLKCVLLLKDKWFWINKCCYLLALLNKLEKFYYWKILGKTIQTLFAIFYPTDWFSSQQPWMECCTRNFHLFNW